jgi:hypothetical protein
MFPLHDDYIHFSRMTTFHVEGKVEFIVPFDEFKISHIIKKCLCVMFDFHPRTVHVSQDDAYDANNNVIKFINDLGLEWRVNCERFRIVAENLLRSFHNIVLMSEIVTSIANIVPHLVEIKQKVLAKHVNLHS